MGPGTEYPVPPEHAEAIHRIEAALETDVVEQALAEAQRHLGMDASYLTEIDSRNQTIHAMFGDDDIVSRYQGTVFPVEQTFCMRMLTGAIPNAVPDTSAEPAISELDAAREFHAYLGVPVRLSNGQVHGTICCVSKETRPGLGPDEVRFMQVLADIVAARVEQVHGDVARLTERLNAKPGNE